MTLCSKNCFLTPEPFSLNGSSKLDSPGLWHMQSRKELTAILLCRAIYCPERLPAVPVAKDNPDFNKTIGGGEVGLCENKPGTPVNLYY